MNQSFTQDFLSQESNVQRASSLKYTCRICNKEFMKHEDLMFHLQNNPSCFLLLLSCDGERNDGTPSYVTIPTRNEDKKKTSTPQKCTSCRLLMNSTKTAQERFQRDRDLALAITIGLYILNIVDANVDAHLKQFNVDDNLALDFKPFLEYNPVTTDPNYGLGVIVKF